MKTSARTQTARELFSSLFGMDFRTMAAVRIGCGVLIVWDLLHRSLDFSAFYTDEGVLPRHALIEHFQNTWHLSVHLLSGRWEVQFALFLLAGLCGVALAVGYRTRLMTILSWFLLLSLQNRNPIILNAGDFVLRMALFWGMFLPWGKYFSVDAVFAKRRPAKRDLQYCSAGTVGFLLQISFIYFFTAMLKTGNQWRIDGTAVYYSLALDQFQLPLAKLTLQFPTAMTVLTFATFWFEAIAPVIVYFPRRTAMIRIGVVVGLWLLHFALALHLRLGLFSQICMVVVAAYLPGEFWDRLFARFPQWRRPDLFKRIARHPILSALPPRPPVIAAPTVRRVENGAAALALFFLGYVFVWNLSTLEQPAGRIPASMTWIAHTLRLDQKWAMFAPFPMIDDGWYVMPGKRFDYPRTRELVDVWREGRPVDWSKPASVTNLYPTSRWRKYLRRLWETRYKDHRLYFGKYVCRKWNREHQGARRLESFQIVFMRENTRPHGEDKPRPYTIWNHWCFGKPS